MSPFPIVLLAMFAAQIGGPCRPSSMGTSTHIQFLAPQDVRSPDCRWLLEVRRTIIAGDEFGEVTVRAAAGANEASRLLFRFQRDAVLSWRSDGRILVVENQRAPLYSQLMLFDLARAVQSPAEALEIDGVVQADVERRIAPGHHVETYIPQFLAWAGSDAIILVDAASLRGTVGSLTGHCFGARQILSPSQSNIYGGEANPELPANRGSQASIRQLFGNWFAG